MKRIGLLVIGLTLLLLGNQSSSCAQSDRPVVTVGYYDYEPYFQLDSKGNVSGIYHDIIQLIAKDLGFSVDYQMISVNDAVERLKNNELDLIIGLHFTKDRQNNLIYSDTSIGSEEVAIYTTAKLGYGDIESLNGAKIALIRNEENSKWIENFLTRKGIEFDSVVYVNTYSEAIQTLLLGQVDAIIATVYNHIFSPDQQLYRYSSGSVYIGGSSKNVELMNEISNQLKEYEYLKVNPINEIYNDYLPDSSSIKNNLTIILFGTFSWSLFYCLLHPTLKRKYFRNQIRRQMINGQYLPYYQPIINPMTGAVVGVEALLRFRHHKKGVLSPYFFMHELEIYDMLQEVTLSLFSQVLKDYRKIQDFSFAQSNPIYISLNISSKEVEDEKVVETLIKQLKASNLPRESICLEIIERFGISDINKMKAGISRLKKSGFKVAIDDFGVDYSNLKVLEVLDFDLLKLDKYFVDEMQNSSIVSQMIDFLAQLTANLEKVMIIEGVERQEQKEAIKNYDYSHLYIQGYYYSKPLPIEELENFIVKE